MEQIPFNFFKNLPKSDHIYIVKNPAGKPLSASVDYKRAQRLSCLLGRNNLVHKILYSEFSKLKEFQEEE